MTANYDDPRAGMGEPDGEDVANNFDDAVLYQPMTEEDGEVGRFVVELRKQRQILVEHKAWLHEQLSAASGKPSIVRINSLVDDALGCDGEHHARWYLEQLADLLGVPIHGFRRGIAP